MNRPKTPSNALIRSAVREEAAIISYVLRQAFVEFEPLYTPEAFAATTPTSAQIQKRWSEGSVWVVAEGSQIVGTISAVPKAEGFYIRSMAVIPSHRGRGLGYLLLQTVEHAAKTQGIRRMFLSTTPFLTGAIRLYEQFGFHRNDPPHELSGTPLFTMVKLIEPVNQAHQSGINSPIEKKKVRTDEE